MTTERKRPLTPHERAILRLCLDKLEQAEADYQASLIADAMIGVIDEQRTIRMPAHADA